MSMQRNLQIRGESQCVFLVISVSESDHFRCKIVTFLVIRNLRLDVAKQEAKIDRKWERERQIPHSSWSIFRAKGGMGLGAKLLHFYETILDSTKVDLQAILGIKMASQDHSPEHAFWVSNFETRFLKKVHPSHAKTMFFFVFWLLIITNTKRRSDRAWVKEIRLRNVESLVKSFYS